ncbi:MAG: DUF3379 family protein [Pseudomonadota bacterium]
MDLEQYKIYLKADPRSREPEFLEASRASIENAKAHAEALAFEDKLEQALRIPVEDPSEEEILLHCWNAENVDHDHSSSPSMWLAMAASVLMLVGVASMFWPAGQVDADVREAFIAHLDHPMEQPLAAEGEVPAAAIALAFANRGMALEGKMENVSYLKRCVIGDVQGLHLVLTDSEGDQITVMVMPDEPLERIHNFTVDSMTVQMVPSDAGAVALFGHQGQDLSPLARELSRGLTASQSIAQL